LRRLFCFLSLPLFVGRHFFFVLPPFIYSTPSGALRFFHSRMQLESVRFLWFHVIFPSPFFFLVCLLFHPFFFSLIFLFPPSGLKETATPSVFFSFFTVGCATQQCDPLPLSSFFFSTVPSWTPFFSCRITVPVPPTGDFQSRAGGFFSFFLCVFVFPTPPLIPTASPRDSYLTPLASHTSRAFLTSPFFTLWFRLLAPPNQISPVGRPEG